jgi:hypothetical protein
MQIIAVAVPILFLVFLGFTAWTGELGGRRGTLRRADNPVSFWATIGAGTFFCLLALAGSLRALFSN